MKARFIRFVVRAWCRLPGFVLRRRNGTPTAVDGFTLDDRVFAFQKLMAKLAVKNPTPELTVDVFREGFRQICFLGSANPVSAVSVQDRTIPGPAGDIAVRIYYPPRVQGAADAIVWYHQGGGVLGNLDTDNTMCSILADRCKAIVISVDYRLGPESPFPADLVDGMASYQWVIDQASGLGVDPQRVAVAGASQGGKIAAAVGQQRRLAGLSQPVAQILLYPGLDNAATGGSIDSMNNAWPLSGRTLAFFAAKARSGGAAAFDVRASPGRSNDLGGTPPSVVVTAGFDPLRDQGNAYAAALDEAGIEVITRCEQSLTHSFTVMGGVSRVARKATSRVADDAAKILGVK